MPNWSWFFFYRLTIVKKFQRRFNTGPEKCHKLFTVRKSDPRKIAKNFTKKSRKFLAKILRKNLRKKWKKNRLKKWEKSLRKKTSFLRRKFQIKIRKNFLGKNRKFQKNSIPIIILKILPRDERINFRTFRLLGAS